MSDEELQEGRLYPPLSNIREVSLQMAVKVSAPGTTTSWILLIYYQRSVKSDVSWLEFSFGQVQYCVSVVCVCVLFFPSQ